jgi:F0F1-type ATP synthase membrane subunit b/b'
MSASAFNILDELMDKLGPEESELIMKLKKNHEQICREYNEEIKKYIKWKIMQRKTLAEYQRKNVLKNLKEQRDQITHDIHERMGWIRLIQRYQKES